MTSIKKSYYLVKRGHYADKCLIHFPLNGEPEVKGSLQSPGKISVSYDPDRMKSTYLSKSRDARDGMIFMNVAFNGATNAKDVEMLSRIKEGDYGPTVDLTPISQTMEIPSGVWEIPIWFKGMRRSSMSWDSNYGNNYRFKVTRK